MQTKSQNEETSQIPLLENAKNNIVLKCLSINSMMQSCPSSTESPSPATI